MTTLDILLWVVLPYVTIAVFVTGTFWRFRYDKFGWTTRSSQLYERKLIRIASPIALSSPRQRPRCLAQLALAADCCVLSAAATNHRTPPG